MVIKEDPEVIQSYLEDSSGLKDAFCKAVVFPENSMEAEEFLREASIKKIPVTISGGRTGVAGACLPYGGVVLATDRLNRILDIVSTEKGGYVVLEPGVRIVELEEEIKRFGLIYLPQPTENNAFIGGTLSTNASGARAFKYGSTRNYVRRIKLVLSSGETLEIKRGGNFAQRTTFFLNIEGKEKKIFLPSYKIPDIKNSAGYYVKENMDLIDLFIGQEGTLGLITEIELSLGKKDKNIFGIILFFKEESKALEIASKIKEISFLTRKGKTGSNIDCVSLEFFDYFSLELLRSKFPQIPSGVNSALLIEQEYTSENQSNVLDEWVNFLDKRGILIENSWFSQTEKEKEFFKNFRHALPELVNEIVKRSGFPKIGTDMAVPDRYFNSAFKFYKTILKDTRLDYVVFGHIGDNHLHINILPKNEEEFAKAKLVYTEMVKKVVSLKGTISAEHGIGKLKHKYLEMMFGKEVIYEMAYLKKQFDHSLILGLDNIFPKEILFNLS